MIRTALLSASAAVASAALLAGFAAHPGAGHDTKNAEPAGEANPMAFAYTLGVCPVSGMELGAMGDVIVKSYEGREVRFCCNGCPDQFAEDLDASWEKVDEMIIEDQLPYYPLTTCVVSGEELAFDGEEVAINVVVNNRLFRVCCEGCIAQIEADPSKYAALLDAAVIEAQSDAYPLETCVVAGHGLGGEEGEEPAQIVAGSRLVKFCCGGCESSFAENPAQFLAELDEAWKPIIEESGRPVVELDSE
ncbi:MAG: hypothetical protein AAGJ54_06025 [Planctomycetota bacterium]